MSSFRRLSIAGTVLVLCIVGALLVWSFLQARKEAAKEQEGDRPVSAPSRVSVSQGRTVVRLDEAEQRLNGIVVKALASAAVEGRTGAVVPDSSVVWLDGVAWAYVRKGPDRFVRQRVAERARTGTGWLESRSFSPGDLVVTEGAQLLLSEEFRSQIRISD